MGRGYKRRTNITTKTAISKSELREARQREAEVVSTVRIPNITIRKEEVVKKEENVSIRDVFLKENVSIQELSEKFSISSDEVITKLICELYQNNATFSDIKDLIGISPFRARKILIDNDIEIRSRGSRCKEDKKKSKTEITNKKELKSENKNKEEIKETSMPKVENNIGKIEFAEQVIGDSNLRLIEGSIEDIDNVFVCGLVKDRHVIPFVDKYIFETFTEKQFEDPSYAINKARGFINCYIPDRSTQKTLVVYCTGLQLALSAVVTVCAEMHINLITMHYIPDTQGYLPQNTLCIFGDVPEIGNISGISSLTRKYRNAFSYGCNIMDLISQEHCLYISLNKGEKGENLNQIVLFNKDFPDAEVWDFYGRLIKAMISDECEDKCHSLIMGKVDLSLAGYKYQGGCLTKSYNYRSN